MMERPASYVQGSGTRPQCRVMVCADLAYGLVTLNVLVREEPQRRSVPMCQPCADQVERGLAANRLPALTPDGSLYLHDLRELLGGRK